MKRIQVILAIFICKFTRRILRILGRGGTHLPGVVALKCCPDLLGELGQQVQTVMVTGTNGKTTSARMLEECWKLSGASVFANRSGANLSTGIATEFAVNATWLGKMKAGCAVIECDEAEFKRVASELMPKVILVTNIFCDQLDRYGEITHTVRFIRAGLESVPEATICINADCAFSASLTVGLPNPLHYFGMEVQLYEKTEESVVPENTCCWACGNRFTYTSRTYGHLGVYHCEQCAEKRPVPDVVVSEVLEETAETTKVALCIGEKRDEKHEVLINMPGAYNIYNAAGVIAVGRVLNVDISLIMQAFLAFQGGFGRMERFSLGEQAVCMALIKNPIGCSQVLRYLERLEQDMTLAFCLNDREGDGKDVSWIWDVDAGSLARMGERLKRVYCSGIRADELAVWIKYSGICEEKIHVEYDLGQLLSRISVSSTPVFIMPSYTAMITLRERLSKNYGLAKIWE